MLTLEDARAWYSGEDSVHGFDHIQRVCRLAQRLAQEESADQEIVYAAALLHDAQEPERPDRVAVGLGGRQEHHHTSANFARQVLQAEGWPAERAEAVLHCIRAHRFRDPSERPATLEAQVLFDADKLDAIGAVGAARAIAFSAQNGAPFYAPPSPAFLTKGQLEPGELHSAYHEYLYKLSRLKERLFTSAARNLAEERHQVMAAFFARLQQEAQGEA